MKARSTCFLLGLGLVGLSMTLPASAQQTPPEQQKQTQQQQSILLASASPEAAPATPATPAVPETATLSTSAPAQDAPAQGTPAPASAPAAAPAAAPTWSIGPIDFEGTIDGYYNLNFNHPLVDGTNDSEQNFLYNFNTPANQFSLNMAKLGMSHMPDPVGFEFDFMYGNTNAIIPHASGFDEYVENAYVSFKPAVAKGIELDFGKFVTSAGAEVIESYSNWNYSRSLLFSWAIPYFHFGLRSTIPVGKKWVVGAQLVNGWNNTIDNNSAKTLGVTAMGTYSKFMINANYYGGPENPGSNSGWKALYDTTLTLTPTAKFNAYINYDYGDDQLYNTFPYTDGTHVHWDGIAGALHFMPTSKWSFTPRLEWFNDPQGFAMLGASLGATASGEFDVNPVPQQVKEFTGTVEYKWLEGLMFRGEYRYDWSTADFFLKGGEPACTGLEHEVALTVGNCPADFGQGNSKNQSTLTFAIIGYFGPKR